VTDIKKIKTMTIMDIVNDIANMVIKLGIRCDKAGILKSYEKDAILNNTSGALAAVAHILEIGQDDIDDWMEKEASKHGVNYQEMIEHVNKQMKMEAN
tara:strand:+ start:1681 stop:1974 length:294 start_codon:yes stop_codon:yes gene_type:complete